MENYDNRSTTRVVVRSSYLICTLMILSTRLYADVSPMVLRCVSNSDLSAASYQDGSN